MENAWLKLSKNEDKKVTEYCEEYKSFLDVAKTERLATEEIIKIAEENGFKNIEQFSKKKPKSGDKIYVNYKGKSLIMFVVGTENVENGMNMVGAHLDSPRLDLKANPLYESDNIAKLKTHYYGGVKKYQYATIPLAMHGVVYNKNGEKVEIHIGEDDNDPVFCVSDLLIHLSKDQMQKTLAEGITGEQLNVIIGNKPIKDGDKNSVKKHILNILKEKYNIEEEDFKIAELEIVPAGKAKDLGLDRSMILAYGHDDRVCAFATLKAMLEVKKPKKTAVGIFVDKEEIGSVGNTGMASHIFENIITEFINLSEEATYLKVQRALKNSRVLSADVTVGYDPDFAETTEKLNTAYIGNGIALCKYTGSRGKAGSNDASAEFLNEVRKTFDDNNVAWQTGELGKVDQGGGGTIAYLISKYGAEVVDCGTPVLSMHAPYEIASKVDCYMTYKCYLSFLK